MTKSHLLVAIAGCVLVAGVAVFTATAQGPARAVTPPQVPAPRIAMLDVGFIFKNHTGFKARKADLEAEMTRVTDAMKREDQAVRKMIDDLQELQKTKAGSLEAKQLEEQIARRRAELEIQLRLQNKEFTNKEASVYHAVYQEIEEEVNYFATQNRIDAVLRFNGDPVDKGQPNDIIRNVNKQVIWFAQDLDITKIILDRLKLKYGGGQQTARDPARPGSPTLPSPY